MPLVIATFDNAHLRETVTQCLRGWSALRFHELSCELPAYVMHHDTDVLLIDADSLNAAERLQTLRCCRRRAPATAIVACISLLQRSVHSAVGAATAGLIDDVIVLGHDELAAKVRLHASTRRDRSVADEIVSRGTDLIPLALQAVIGTSARRARGRLSVTELAAASGVHRRTLSESFRCARLPPPHTIVSWHRVLHVASHLSRGSRSIRAIAADLQFPSPSDLSHRVANVLGVPPSALRASDAFANCLDAYEHALRHHAHGVSALPRTAT